MSTRATLEAVDDALTPYSDRGLYPRAITDGNSDDFDSGDGFIADTRLFADYWFKQPNANSVEELIAEIPTLFDWDYMDNVAEWHRETQHAVPVVRAHILRLVKGWEHESALATYLRERPFLATSLGFESIPSQSSLWKTWHQQFSERDRELVERAAQTIIGMARLRGVPAPDRIFLPSEEEKHDDVDSDDEIVADLTAEKTKEIWEQAKPLVTDEYSLDRGENAHYDESGWWEAQAFMGSRSEMCANGGLQNFRVDSTRDEVHTGDTHRHHLKQISIADARRMHRGVVMRLIQKARRKNELVGKLTVAIDVTKSNPYRSSEKLEFDDGECQNDWLLGYKDKEHESADYYFQWASVQVVGWDVPLVLDAVPVRRGMSRREIVAELLRHTTDMVDMELVLMDREFDGGEVKAACENNGVYYANPKRMHSSERATCSRLREEDKDVLIQQQPGIDENLPDRKTVYLPAMSPEFSGDEIEGDEHKEPDEDTDDEPGMRDALIEEFESVFKDDEEASEVSDEERDERMFDGIGDEVLGEADLDGSDEDASHYVVFETNHPGVSITDDRDETYDEIDQIHMVSRLLRQYTHRWGIERGYRDIKSFRVRTTSMDHQFRFFNFLFSCSLYNVWRLVDLLVKLSLERDPDYAPLVTSDLFLTVAKQYVGLDPPD